MEVNLVANEAEDWELIAEAKQLALAWLEDHRAVDPDMAGVVLNTPAWHGDRDLFDRLRAAARKERDETPRAHLLSSLGHFRDPAIIQAALPIVLSDEFDGRESLIILFATA